MWRDNIHIIFHFKLRNTSLHCECIKHFLTKQNIWGRLRTKSDMWFYMVSLQNITLSTHDLWKLHFTHLLLSTTFIILACEFLKRLYCRTFSMHLRSVLIFRIHQPTPMAFRSDHWGSPFCMAGIILSNSSSASEWKAQAKWHVDKPKKCSNDFMYIKELVIQVAVLNICKNISPDALCKVSC